MARGDTRVEPFTDVTGDWFGVYEEQETSKGELTEVLIAQYEHEENAVEYAERARGKLNDPPSPPPTSASNRKGKK